MTEEETFKLLGEKREKRMTEKMQDIIKLCEGEKFEDAFKLLDEARKYLENRKTEKAKDARDACYKNKCDGCLCADCNRFNDCDNKKCFTCKKRPTFYPGVVYQQQTPASYFPNTGTTNNNPYVIL